MTESSPAPFANLGPFAGTVLPSGAYWSSTEGGVQQHRFFRIADTAGGCEATGADSSNLYAWAVHDGDVRLISPAPVPGLTPLAAVGLVGFALCATAHRLRREVVRAGLPATTSTPDRLA